MSLSFIEIGLYIDEICILQFQCQCKFIASKHPYILYQKNFLSHYFLK